MNKESKFRLFSRYFLSVFATAFFLLSGIVNASTLFGPKADLDGSFQLKWDANLLDENCYNFKFSAANEYDYSEIFNVEKDETLYQFQALPEGSFVLVLSGECVEELTGEVYTKAFGGHTITIGDTGAPQALIGQNKNSAVQATGFSAVSAQAIGGAIADEGLACGSFCASGTHPTAHHCYDELKTGVPGVFANCGFTGLCAKKPSSYVNMTTCAANTNEFTQCGITCPDGYNRTETLPSSLKCRGRTGARCVINKEPPKEVTLKGNTTRYDAKIEITWGSVRNVGYYEWRLASGNWKRNTNRKISLSNQSAGIYTFGVRACNEFGCSKISKKTVTLRKPQAPKITSSATTGHILYKFSWEKSAGATSYKWRKDSGAWESITSTSVYVGGMKKGSYTLDVQACNPKECGTIANITVKSSYVSCPTINVGVSCDGSGWCQEAFGRACADRGGKTHFDLNNDMVCVPSGAPSPCSVN